MADIGGNARGVGDIIESESGNEGVELHEKSERLSDPSGSAQDGDFPIRDGLGRVAPAEKLLGGGGFRHGPQHFGEWKIEGEVLGETEGFWFGFL
ncbi:hypothetical protein SLA2020_004400 [Shorea laevis]